MNTPAIEPVASPPLPERLRLETRDLHQLSERSGVMADLLAQRLPRAGYVALLRNLHAIYAALESALQRCAADAAVAQLGTAALVREPALAADLDVLAGADWRSDLPLAAATQDYVQRLQTLGQTQPLALVAHAYVRYLGDLHGGQVLKRLLVLGLGLPAGAGTSFYDFGPQPRVVELRAAFRHGLARVADGGDRADLIVAEARWAFAQHVLLFEQLAQSQSAAPQPSVR